MLRILIFASAIVIAAVLARAQGVPLVEDAPKTTSRMDRATFEFVSKTLHGNRLAKHLNCELRVRTGKDLRKFSNRQEWVEYLEVDYKTNVAGGGHEMKLKVPMQSSRYGRQMVSDIWAGRAEDFVVEVGDLRSHWLRFKHDGQGQLVFFSMGSDLRTLPCIYRD